MSLSRTSQAVAVTRAGFARRAGWRITAPADAADLGTGAEPGRSLLVTAEPAG